MNREELKALGLSDDQIEKVMASHGKVVNSTKEKADRVESLEAQIVDLNEQIKDRDDQLEELKKVDAEGLRSKIDDLQKENETVKTEYEEQLTKQAFEFTLEKTLANAGVRNPKAVKALLDTEKIKLDGETLLGLDDQLKAVKESDPYLFQEEAKPNSPTIVTGGNPNGGGSGTVTKSDIMKEKDATKRQQMIRENSHLFQ